MELTIIAPEDLEEARKLLNGEILCGGTWPFEEELSPSEFEGYFNTYDAFVVKVVEAKANFAKGEIVGTFYIKVFP